MRCSPKSKESGAYTPPARHRLPLPGPWPRSPGTWFSPGIETDLYDPADPAGTPDKTNTAGLEASANYVWQEYALDFVKVQDSWKIQKVKVRTFFDTPFDTPWSQAKDTMWAKDRVISEMQ